ncbi:MAG: cyclic pyranopterin monophosphate synthase MoaC [Candidatus Latescibacterota bacterium]|jgi:cyclic pyranopterin phosphate synthase
MAGRLSHLDAAGRLRMVDVGAKPRTRRLARARGEIRLSPDTVALIESNQVAKGNVLEAARLAGIMAAKRTAELIPLCHPLPLAVVTVDFVLGPDRLEVTAEARVTDRTGVEMEALTAATVALLTVYDMCKAVDRGMTLSEIRLVEKRGGRSGTYRRPDRAG